MSLATLVLAFLIMLLIVGGMAVGVLFGRKPIEGSCGGMKRLGMDVECEICGGNPALCDEGAAGSPGEQSSGKPLWHDADGPDRRQF